jgi:hypothetical protein
LRGKALIPGRAVSAKAESNRQDNARGRIPGPACGRPGMTIKNHRDPSGGFASPTLEGRRTKL